jgi:hypothetical protein
MNQDQSKTDGAAPVSSTPLLGHPDITSRDLEIEQVERAIANTYVEILRVEGVLEQMCRKQIARHCEVIRQKTLARCPNK